MRVDVRASNLKLDEQLKDHIERRVRLVLSRFSSRIRSVSIRLNVDRALEAGADKRCRILIHFSSSIRVCVEDVQQEISCAVDGSVERAARAILRLLCQ